MTTKETYEKYEANQTKDKVVDSSIGGTFEGEHFDQNNPSGKIYFAHPSQAEINEMAHHKAITCYDRLPDKDKDKPGVHSYEPNVSYLDMVGATQRPGDRKYGEQED
mgnify:CR=1 FL=1|tara:strand:- start:349 stop:669 length:321 start_codon:yes stop_codon:yes gene_type:complete